MSIKKKRVKLSIIMGISFQIMHAGGPLVKPTPVSPSSALARAAALAHFQTSSAMQSSKASETVKTPDQSERVSTPSPVNYPFRFSGYAVENDSEDDSSFPSSPNSLASSISGSSHLSGSLTVFARIVSPPPFARATSGDAFDLDAPSSPKTSLMNDPAPLSISMSKPATPSPRAKQVILTSPTKPKRVSFATSEN